MVSSVPLVAVFVSVHFAYMGFLLMTLRDSFLVNIKIYSFKFESEVLDLYFKWIHHGFFHAHFAIFSEQTFSRAPLSDSLLFILVLLCKFCQLCYVSLYLGFFKFCKYLKFHDVLNQLVMVIDLNQWEGLHILWPSKYKDITEKFVPWKRETLLSLEWK